MVEVFYRTTVTEEQQDVTTEFYSITFIAIGAGAFVVTQYHGWWNHELQRSQYDALQLNTMGEPVTESEGWRIYSEQRSHILELGFTVGVRIPDNPPPNSPISWLG
jgi:hypothetical protein